MGPDGDCEVKVLSFNLGSDTGGASIAIKRAFDHCAPPGWEFHSLMSMQNYINYPQDVAWSRKSALDWWDWADVIHLHNNFASSTIFENGFRGMRRMPRKPYVITFHGESNFHGGVGRFASVQEALSACRVQHAIPIVTTLNTHLLAPAVFEWVPIPYETEMLRRYRTGWRPRSDGSLLIGQAPTSRLIKNTDELVAAVRELQRRDHAVELLLVEGQSWEQCLQMKARCDIFVDQVGLSYGCNAIESGGMGIATVAGAQPATVAEMVRRFGAFPFEQSREGGILDTLEWLVVDPPSREKVAAAGMAFVQTWHNEQAVVDQLISIYQRAA